MKKQIKVIYKKFGLANFFGDYVEINKKLKHKKYKKLRDYIIKHELGHVKGFDLWHEFKVDWKIMPSLMWFFFTTPSSWIDLFPIQIRKGKLIYDVNLIILYLMIISLIYLLNLFF